MARTLTRRQALAAGGLGGAAALAGGAGLVQAGVLPGRHRVGRLLGACDVGGPPPTTVAPGPLRLASFPSRRRGRPVGYGIAWPPGSGPGDRLPVCLLLHAAAGNERAPFERLRLHHHLAQAVGADRIRPFALASADGRGSGWRPAAGDDPFGMLLDATSPAIAGTGSEVAAAGRLSGMAVRVDCGANDPFAPATRALAAALPTAQVTVAKGCHDGVFWQHQAPAQLRFLSAALGGGRG